MNENAGIKPWQWVVTVVVIIILIILGIYLFKGNGTPATDQTNQQNTPTTTTPAAANRIVVSDQFPGNIVYVSSVQLAQPGWVVIKADNNGVPGAIIGKAWFDKGINPGKITLTKSTVEGGLYYAQLYSDNGDQKFDATVDMPLKDANGNIIMKTFRATASATEVKG